MQKPKPSKGSDGAASFLDASTVASYVADTPQKVPGLADLHKMAAVLLAEEGGPSAHLLVVGAGGGLELKAMAELQPSWRFTGVDPSPPMLEIARLTTSAFEDRMSLILGKIEQVPDHAFDGATCLLTLHFLDRTERVQTLRQIRSRLRPGAMLVVAHHAAPDNQPETWLARSVAFAGRSGLTRAQAAASAKAMIERLPLLSPSEEAATFRDAGFVDAKLFYAAFSFRGWVMTAPDAKHSEDDRITS